MSWRRHIGNGYGTPWNVVRDSGTGKGTAGLWDGNGWTGLCSSDHTDRVSYAYGSKHGGGPRGHSGEGEALCYLG